jgi:hypothetical protein
MKITVRADVNDGDYEENTSDINAEQLASIMPLVEAIRNFKPYQGEWSPGQFTTHDHNFPTGEQLRTDMGERTLPEIYPQIEPAALEYFETLLPFDEFGVHTVDGITVDGKKLL